MMKRTIIVIAFVFACFLIAGETKAQCSICTKTASQLGEKPARGLNTAILYLMIAPFGIAGFIGYRWHKANRKS